MRFSTRAFTLIELLIVVAIIAILAAIAVPNFLEAQTRAKVSRAKADMRSIATANETYMIDHSMYLYQNRQSRGLRINAGSDEVFERLTSPIAYLAGVWSFKSPFKATKVVQGAALDQDSDLPANQIELSQIYWYTARNNGNANGSGSAQWGRNDPKPSWYFTQSAGPMSMLYGVNDATQGMYDTAADQEKSLRAMYDATNGTISRGGIFRVGGSPTPLAKALYNAIAGTH